LVKLFLVECSSVSNKIVKLIAIVAVVAIIISIFNTVLILNNNFSQNGQTGEMQSTLDKTNENLEEAISELSALRNQTNMLNQSTSSNLDEIRLTIDNIENVLSQLADRDQLVKELLRQTAAEVYASAYKSVVLIRTAVGQGSGFLFNNSNTIVTNYHVVEDENDIEIEYYDRTRTPATTIGSDPYSDIAVLTVSESPADAQPLMLSNRSVSIGQQVVALGNPLGLTDSLSVGYISQVNRTLDIEPIIIPVFQLDLTIAPGSSGGPLLDLYGNLVGITNAGTEVGFNFAVPVSIISRVIPSLIETGGYTHPYLGVSIVALTPEVISSLNILNVDEYQNGLLVMDVVSGSPADEAALTAAQSVAQGYNAMDIILSIDGNPTFVAADLTAYLELGVSPGETITLSLWRSGETDSVSVTTTERPAYQG
jgi:serine protease Do